MKENKVAALRISAALLTVALVTLGIHAIRGGVSAAPDFECRVEGQEVTVEIPSGASGSQVAKILFEKGVTKSTDAYFRTAVANPKSTRVAPGAHLLTVKNCAKEVLAQLLDSARISGLINISEGAWNSEIVDQMVLVGFKRSEVMAAISSAQLPTGIKGTEGVLFPAQYSFAKGTTAVDAISQMVDRGKSELGKSGILAATGKYTPQKLLIMASIIQAEADTKDFPKVSQVIRNRLEKGIPLQMDSTVHYIKKSRGKMFLSTASTFLKSPFNTYRNYGLPPGAIGNPGALAMSAAINPTLGNWLYFITVAPGDTRFTADISEFNNWKVLYKQNLKSGFFRSKK
jgi:UPF0755 protein